MSQNSGTTGIVETDMATLARAVQAHQDLEGWLLSLPHRRRVTPEDAMRVDADLHYIGAGLAVVRKHLTRLHAAGWPAEEGSTGNV